MVQKKNARKAAFENLKEILLVRREALRQAIDGDDRLLKELSQQGGDVVDFATDSAYGELSSQIAEVENRELQATELALKHMKEGTYGNCEACHCQIPLAGLEVLPFGPVCIKCKRKAEIHGVEPGNVVDWSIILATDENTMGEMDFRIS